MPKIMYSHKKHYFDELLDFANAINHTFLQFIIVVIQRDKDFQILLLYKTLQGQKSHILALQAFAIYASQ